MQFSNQLIYSHTEKSFDIALDEKLYQCVVEDMLENSGNFLPRANWVTVKDAATEDDQQREKMSIEETRRLSEENKFRFPKLTDMLTPWIGSKGRLTSKNQVIIDQTREWLAQLGAEQMLDMLLEKSYVMYSDVRTVSEVAMLGHLPLPDNIIHILEIGGGYGRLCEAMLNVWSGKMLYILADSVPLSLVYAWLFLKKNCPQKRIGIYLDDPNPDFEQYDCYIVPTWRLEQLIKQNSLRFDLAINVQSMQEMSQWHVDTYLKLFDCALKNGGYIYLDNNKQYLFQGKWNYPPNWRMLLRYNTPFSWSDDCPVEIFCKMKCDQEFYNAVIQCGHAQSIKDKTVLRRTKETTEQMESLLKKLHIEAETDRAEVERLRAELEKVCLARSELEQLIASKQRAVEALRHQVERKCVESDELRHQIEEMYAEANHLRGQVETNRIEADKFHNCIEELTHSFSWKITRPLRFLSRLLRKLSLRC